MKNKSQIDLIELPAEAKSPYVGRIYISTRRMEFVISLLPRTETELKLIASVNFHRCQRRRRRRRFFKVRLSPVFRTSRRPRR